MLKLFRHKSFMDEDARRALGEAGKKYLERFEKFDDRAIGRAWVELAKKEPQVRTATRRGLALTVKRTVVGVYKVSYEGYLDKHERTRVAWMHCMMPIAGRVQVSNANVYDIDGVDCRRRGIGTAIYDVIDRDVREAGGEGLEPHWGSMSDDAVAFWKKRRPDRVPRTLAHSTSSARTADPGCWISGDGGSVMRSLLRRLFSNWASFFEYLTFLIVSVAGVANASLPCSSTGNVTVRFL